MWICWSIPERSAYLHYHQQYHILTLLVRNFTDTLIIPLIYLFYFDFAMYFSILRQLLQFFAIYCQCLLLTFNFVIIASKISSSINNYFPISIHLNCLHDFNYGFPQVYSKKHYWCSNKSIRMTIKCISFKISGGCKIY